MVLLGPLAGKREEKANCAFTMGYKDLKICGIPSRYCSACRLRSYGQSLGTAGTIRGKITDPSGASVVGATVSLANDLTLYRRDAKTSSAGEFQFTNIPPNVYHLEVDAAGFQHQHRDLTVRSAVPVSLEIALAIDVATRVGDGRFGNAAD